MAILIQLPEEVVFQKMKVKGYTCVLLTHHTHVNITEVTEDTFASVLEIGFNQNSY
jgi:hypothetical protein